MTEKTKTPKKPAKEKAVKEKSSKDKSANPMRSFYLEKVTLSASASGPDLDKAQKLLQLITGRKANKNITQKRIPDFDVRPGLEVGTSVTIRGEETAVLLKRLLTAVENKLKKSQVAQNTFSFGIEEYIEIPGVEYQRDLGIRGLNVTVTFARPGFRIKRKKIKSGKIPQRQFVAKEDIINYMGEHFKTKFK
jgi:large subunit ribosomal protein L5